MKLTTSKDASNTSGQWAEMQASAWLCKKGLKVAERNYSCRHGELDLVMSGDHLTVFVEVRYRRSNDYGSPAETITRAKQQRLIATAEHYLQRHKKAADNPCRFDVVVISGRQENYQIEWIENALQNEFST